MLEQLKIIFYCENEVDIRIGYKVERQLDRIRYGKTDV
jgi:hypothetical protein